MLRMGVVSTAVCAEGTDNLHIIHEKARGIKQFWPQTDHKSKPYGDAHTVARERATLLRATPR